MGKKASQSFFSSHLTAKRERESERVDSKRVGKEWLREATILTNHSTKRPHIHMYMRVENNAQGKKVAH